ncbi:MULTISPECIES: TetR/AcrR family transcriptional regulator [Streptomyces]|uniref:TetR family transcriptional regulator n=2 Tax=Streptomyces rimosus subsp. rimosus TaxID=132474 RepID=L8EU77_STRR1|nr:MULTISPECIES: TetR family transcriptional regulator C-terminal domain-containing protein [Streptomyces]KOG70449.1 TetR family transcriptional regulator [Kitasatospora aureofaciens]MYT43479.1 TetR family transcriptional regulator [Streptomyces sp. SID5471]KEF06302.1 TetR family transcriptional regulator [Streptomyces rimosus]KEF17123.1 TetR family transcriptional regulator [Streptomyces rimosus]KUJ29263.1 TetR family transcriptional regulator [Streptomyces rimosus subsp. rimosus]
MSERRVQILEAATRTIARNGVRGLRVEEIAAEAGVSTGLIYYHFGGRAELLRRTLDFIGERAERHTTPDPETVRLAGPRAQLEEMLLRELQDTPEMVENSTAWGEFQSSAVFDTGLREQLREATRQWTDDLADLVREAQAAGTADRDAPVADVAERLTALVEGLSTRWLSGSVPLDRARELLRGGIERELGPATDDDPA